MDVLIHFPSKRFVLALLSSVIYSGFSSDQQQIYCHHVYCSQDFNFNRLGNRIKFELNVKTITEQMVYQNSVTYFSVLS